MTKFAMKFNNSAELRAELDRLEKLSDIREEQINNQFHKIKKQFDPAISIFNIITGRKSLAESGFPVSAAFVKGIKMIAPYFLPPFLAGKQGGILGALTTVGGELILNNLKNIDISNVSSMVTNLFKKKKPTEEYPKDNYRASED